MPDFELEKSADGFVCGLDEVGRAPLAGPVVAACVHIPVDNYDNPLWLKVNDSKALSRKTRENIVDEIKAHSSWAIAEVCAREIENINIVQASFLAMLRAYEIMDKPMGLALMDGNLTPKSFPCGVTPVIKGDAKSVSIAAASIIAKVHRDNLMAELAKAHPHYGWERNVGYPTREHMDAIDRHGITDFHRKTFAPVQNFLEFGSTQRQMAMAL